MTKILYRERIGRTATIGKKLYKRDYPLKTIVFIKDAETELRRLKNQGYNGKVIVRRGGMYHPKRKYGKGYREGKRLVKFYEIYKRKT